MQLNQHAGLGAYWVETSVQVQARRGVFPFVSKAADCVVCSGEGKNYLTSSLVVDGIPVRRHNALLDIRTNINRKLGGGGGAKPSQAKATQATHLGGLSGGCQDHLFRHTVLLRKGWDGWCPSHNHANTCHTKHHRRHNSQQNNTSHGCSKWLQQGNWVGFCCSRFLLLLWAHALTCNCSLSTLLHRT